MKRPNNYSGILKVSTGISKENVYLVRNTCDLPAIFCWFFFFPGMNSLHHPMQETCNHCKNAMRLFVGRKHTCRKIRVMCKSRSKNLNLSICLWHLMVFIYKIAPLLCVFHTGPVAEFSVKIYLQFGWWVRVLITGDEWPRLLITENDISDKSNIYKNGMM